MDVALVLGGIGGAVALVLLFVIARNTMTLYEKPEIAKTPEFGNFINETGGVDVKDQQPKDWCKGDIWNQGKWTGECPDAPSPFDVIWLGDTKAEVKANCEANGGTYDERFNQDEMKQWPVCYFRDHYFKVHLPAGTNIGCVDIEVCYGFSKAPQ